MTGEEGRETLNELFRRSGGAALSVGGRSVHLALDIPVVNRSARGILRFVRAAGLPVQGVSLSVKNGRIEVAGQVAQRMVLWVDTAPSEVSFAITRNSKNPCVLRVWNCWRGGASGEPQEWLDNAGLRFEERTPGQYIIECSDGWDEPDFDDLVVELRVTDQGA